MANFIEEMAEGTIKMAWSLMKAAFRLFLWIITALFRKLTEKKEDSANPSKSRGLGNVDAVLAEAGKHYSAMIAALDNATSPEIISFADKAIKPLNELRTQFEMARNPMVTDLRFLEANTLYHRWKARAEIVPGIGLSSPGETCEDVIRRRAERDAAINGDLEMSDALIKQAAEGSPQMNEITPERINNLMQTIALSKMRVTRIQEQGGAYSKDKQRFRSNPEQFEGGLYALGVTAERAELFENFSSFAEELIAANPTSVALLNGAAEAYEYGIDSSKVECQDEETAKKTIGYLKLASRHNDEALRIDPENAHSLYIRGVICSRLNDKDGLAVALKSLRPVEEAKPWSEDEKKIYSEIRQFVWPSRTVALEAILKVMNRS